MRVIKLRGVKGVYKGMSVTYLRDLPGFAVYFTVYEQLRPLNESAGLKTIESKPLESFLPFRMA